MPSHAVASTVCVALTDTSGSVCSLSASSTPSAQVFIRLDTDRALTHRCIDGVCGTHGHFRLRVLAVGCLDAVSLVSDLLVTDRALTHRCIDGVCDAHGHFRLRVLAVGFLDAVSSDFGRLDTDYAVTHRCINGVCGAHG